MVDGSSEPRLPQMLRVPFWIAVTAVIGYASDWFAMQFTLPDSIVAVVYPTMGIAIAIGILVGPWVALGPFLSELALWLPQSDAPGLVLAMSAAGALQIFVVSYVARAALGGRDAFDTRAGVLRFALVAGVLGMLISATGGVGSLYAAGIIPLDEVAMSWFTWWAADVVSVLLLAPLILAFTRPSERGARPLAERLTLTAVTVAITVGILAWPFQEPHFVLALLGLPVIGWAGFRFGRRTVAVVSVSLATAAFGHLIVPWYRGVANVPELLESQLLIALASVTGLLVAANVREERSRARLAAEHEFHVVNDARNHLLHSFAHELNNPLTPIRLQLEVLRAEGAEPLTPAQAKGLDVIDRNSRRLARLVGDLRDVSHLQAGDGLSVNVKRVDLAQVARDVLAAQQAPASAARLRLHLDAGTVIAAGDPDRLTQVLDNLVDNAIKYSAPGGAVRVDVTERGGEAVVSVRDAGCGLDKAQIARLFTPFSQVQPDSVQKHGTGLGLHIARGIVQSHGGVLRCESDGPGQGASFTFTVPLHRPRAAAGVVTTAVPREDGVAA